MCSQLQRRIAVMALITLLILATALHLFSLTAGRPVVVRESGQAAMAENYHCSSFNNAICNSIDGQGYNHAVFPNPLAPSYLTTIATSEMQANIYIPLAVASGCSTHVAKFLCFSYFPFCIDSTPSIPPVLPCPSFCKKVKADCEPYLISKYAMVWPQWLDCDKMGKLYNSQNICVNETEIAVTPTATTSVRSVVTTMSTPFPTTAITPLYANGNSDCGVCSPRTNVSSGTFRVAVNNYTFAAKVTVENKTVINHVIMYRVTVINQYLPNCSNSAQLPKTGALIKAFPEQCSPCFDMQSGQTYVIGGYYYLNSGGDVTWEVPRKRGVVAPWTDKYDSKLDNWMKAAASDRPC